MRKIPVLLLFFAVTSCLNQANCLITSTNLVKVNLKKLADSSTATITFNSITVSGTSIVLTPSVAVSALNLPVDPATNETTFLFNYVASVEGVNTDKTATLTVGYASQVRLISEDCGAYQYQINLDVISTNFERTKLINTSLLTGVTSNLEIYL